MEDLRLRAADEIDMERLASEARISEHGEAYQPMGKRGDIRFGVGARLIAPDETAFFIEVVLPVASGSRVDLGELEEKLGTLRRLEEGGFTPTLQEDGGVVCELLTRGEDLQGEYERAVSLIEAHFL
jgi:hypothetical protein